MVYTEATSKFAISTRERQSLPLSHYTLFFATIAFFIFSTQSSSLHSEDSYLLPTNHQLTKKLQRLFHSQAICNDLPSLEKAGFYLVRKSKSGMLTLRHPKCEGWIFKLYPNNHSKDKLLHRIEGANLVQKIISDNQLDHLFKVPKKWLFEIADPELLRPTSYLLIAEEMWLLAPNGNQYHWKHSIDEERLNGLYLIISKANLFDSLYIDNIPFCCDGKLAFVDTEHWQYHPRPIPWRKLERFLSNNSKLYWKNLTQHE